MGLIYDMLHPSEHTGRKKMWAYGMWIAVIVDVLDAIVSLTEWLVALLSAGASIPFLSWWLGEGYDAFATVISTLFFGVGGLISGWEVFLPDDIIDAFIPSVFISGVIVYFWKFADNKTRQLTQNSDFVGLQQQLNNK